ncbi:MAG: hypothetical protein AB1918_01030 [Pseudomonadota bacterium]
MTQPLLRARAVDESRLWDGLAAAMAEPEAVQSLRDHRSGLISPYLAELPRAAVDAIAEVAAALDRVLDMPSVRRSALALGRGHDLPDRLPTPGILGIDFHLTARGPRLIEINTNPGGLLIAAAQAQAVLGTAPLDDQILAAFQEEWQRSGWRPDTVAIVDDDPATQFLFPEFVLYRSLFTRAGLDSAIADPGSLAFDGRSLTVHGRKVDVVYNRLTDFFLEAPGHAARAAAGRGDAALLIPDPLSHALFSDKRLLSLLCDEKALLDHGVDGPDAARIAAAVPITVISCGRTWDSLWERRKSLFFKPAKGHAGKAAYRGDKLSRATWNTLSADAYVAQDLTPAPRVALPSGGSLKADIRAFVRGGAVLLLAARLYEGQTTNFRTPGGGFAPVQVAD